MIHLDMRLVLNAAYDTRLGDGIAHYILRVAPALDRLCELTILTPDPASFPPGCRTRRIPRWTSSRSGRLVWTVALLHRYLPRNCDCVVCPSPVAAPCLPIPTVAVVHDVTPLVQRRALNARTKSAFWASIQTIRWADGVVADSRHTRSDLIRMNLLPGPRIGVVYAGLGVEPTEHNGGFGLDFHPYVLYVGGHTLHKNIGRLVAAFARGGLEKNHRLVMTGSRDAGLLAHTQTAIRYYGVRDRVTILPGGLSDEQVSDLYRNCSTFVYPSLYEGFGLPVLEAMAHGAPVACSRASSLPEVGGDAVLYFDPLSADDIAAKIREILNCRELELALRRHGLVRAREFSWDKAALGIYEAASAAVNREHTKTLSRAGAWP